MRTRRKTLMLVALGVMGVVVILVVWSVSSLTSALSSVSTCNNEVMHEERSPNGRRKAVLFERHCGATTSTSTQVMILAADAVMPNEPGNAFVAYVDPALVRVSWTSNTALSLSRPKLPQSSIFLQEANVEEVSITYAE